MNKTRFKLNKKNLLTLWEHFKELFPRWLMLWSPLFMLISLPAITRWIKEERGVYVQDLILPFVLAFITSALIATVFLRLYTRNRFAAYVGAVLTAGVLGPAYYSIYSFLANHRLTGGLKGTAVFILAAFIIPYILALLVDKFTGKWSNKTDVLAKSIFIIIAVAFSIQAFSLSKDLITTWPQFFYKPPSLSDGSLRSGNDKPDIYYIVLDRYNNNRVLKKQFGYDNSDFTDFLTKKGFYVKPDAYSNYPYTTFSISSTLNANYQTDILERFGKAKDQTYSPYSNGVRYATVAEKLKSLGYSYYHLGTWFEATNYAPLADKSFQPTGQLTVLGHTFTLNTFARQEIAKSVYNRLFQRGLRVGSRRALEFIEKSSGQSSLSNLEELKKIADKPSGGRFIFAHFLLPHDPYTFNADGSINKNYANNNVGKPVKEKYIGQVKFINKEMKDVLSRVLKKSNGEAVVILQADEGAWPTKMNIEKAATPKNVTDEVTVPMPGDMSKWSEADLQMKYGILAAYHLPAVKKSALKSGSDSVNIFRLVLNTYFGGDLPYLPRCYYGFPKGSGHPFLYTDLTEKLTGKDNPACAPDSNFSKK